MTVNYKQLANNAGRLAAATESLVELNVWMQKFMEAGIRGELIEDAKLLNRELLALQVALNETASKMSDIIHDK